MADQDQVNIRELISKEAELLELRRQCGYEKKLSLPEKIIDWLVNHAHEPRRVSRKTYVLLALLCGWFCGAHQFYSGHKIQGVLYLLFCWTGAPLALTVIDILLAYIRYKADEEGMIEL